MFTGTAGNLMSVGKEIYQQRGLSGLYSGLKFKSLHLGGGSSDINFLKSFYTNNLSQLNKNEKAAWQNLQAIIPSDYQ